MAIPTTQKECTTRRIAALIIGLWDKVKDAFLLKNSRGSANGVASLDANGKVPSSQLPSVSDKRNFPKLNFFINGNNGASSQYIKIATITCSASYFDHPFIFRCLSRRQDMYTIHLMLQSLNGYRPGIMRFNVEVPVGVPTSIVDIQLTYDDSGTYRVYTLWANPGTWADVSTVLESENAFAQFVDLISDQYSTSLADPIAPQYIKYAQSITPGSRIGNESTPIFMENTGTLKPCTNVPVIEHVTTIPVSPTVGTIYAL